MQPKEYSIVKHLDKTPVQISIWVLLMSLQYHRQALFKVLDESYVPIGTNVKNLTVMIENVIESHCISFSEKELPFEGLIHKKALHVIVNY